MTDISAKFPGAGPYMGVDPPAIPAGRVVLPAHLQAFTNTTTVTSTAARYYIALWFFTGKQAFAGAMFENSSTADTGKKIKMAWYNATAAGAIGTVAKSFSEYTLDNTAAIRQVASAWTPARGWYWGEFVCDSAAAFRGMSSARQLTGAGAAIILPGVSQLGAVVANYANAENNPSLYIGDYVGGTYANFPEATSLAPTASISGYGGGFFPAFGLYT